MAKLTSNIFGKAFGMGLKGFWERCEMGNINYIKAYCFGAVCSIPRYCIWMFLLCHKVHLRIDFQFQMIVSCPQFGCRLCSINFSMHSSLPVRLGTFLGSSPLNHESSVSSYEVRVSSVPPTKHRPRRHTNETSTLLRACRNSPFHTQTHTHTR